MNVNDFEASESDKKVGCKLVAIFQKQRDLMEKYHPIEQANGVKADFEIPLNLDSKLAQIRLKDFAWRISEELGEATQALEIHADILEHFQEELIDGLHFMVELLILSGVDPEELVDMSGDITQALGDRLDFLLPLNVTMSVKSPQAKDYFGKRSYAVVQELSNAMNCLKNKPWKQTHMPTDFNKYRTHLIRSFINLIEFIADSGMTSKECYEMYIRKNKVNQFRQKSQY